MVVVVVVVVVVLVVVMVVVVVVVVVVVGGAAGVAGVAAAARRVVVVRCRTQRTLFRAFCTGNVQKREQETQTVVSSCLVGARYHTPSMPWPLWLQTPHLVAHTRPAVLGVEHLSTEFFIFQFTVFGTIFQVDPTGHFFHYRNDPGKHLLVIELEVVESTIKPPEQWGKNSSS